MHGATVAGAYDEVEKGLGTGICCELWLGTEVRRCYFLLWMEGARKVCRGFLVLKFPVGAFLHLSCCGQKEHVRPVLFVDSCLNLE